MALSELTSQLIQCCMTNDFKSIKIILASGKVTFDGKDLSKFSTHFEKTLSGAHQKGKGDWNLSMEPADWLKNRSAIVYDFHSGKGNQAYMSLVVEELSDGVWIEVLK